MDAGKPIVANKTDFRRASAEAERVQQQYASKLGRWMEGSFG